MSQQAEFEQVGSIDELGKGAYFWVYISPENDTAKVVKEWTVTLTQDDWTGSISSDDPKPVLQTDGMAGVFQVRVEWRQSPKDVIVDIQPVPGGKPEIGCSPNCASMIAIVANAEGTSANYSTTWDAFCKNE